jgi:large-conductance mechanosensitive channel
MSMQKMKIDYNSKIWIVAPIIVIAIAIYLCILSYQCANSMREEREIFNPPTSQPVNENDKLFEPLTIIA